MPGRTLTRLPIPIRSICQRLIGSGDCNPIQGLSDLAKSIEVCRGGDDDEEADPEKGEQPPRVTLSACSP
jgi:hypothetical protein